MCANSTGAFGAIKLETGAQDVHVEGPLIQDNMASVRPYLVWKTMALDDNLHSEENEESELKDSPPADEADDDEDTGISEDVKQVDLLCRLLAQDRCARRESTSVFDWNNLAFGADLIVQAQSGTEVPVHKLVLAARSPVLSTILAGRHTLQRKEWNITIKLTPSSVFTNSLHSDDGLRLPPWHNQSRLAITGVHPLSILILLECLYTDKVLAVWDPRISRLVSDGLAPFKVKASQIKSELQRLAELLELPLLSKALDAPVKRSPQPSMGDNLLQLSEQVQNVSKNILLDHPSRPDVCLVFADHEVACHSVILRASSEFFASFFDGDYWTKRRWSEEGVVRMDLSHMKWKAASYVVRFLYGGDIRLFDVLGMLVFPIIRFRAYSDFNLFNRICE